jgi:membrane protein
MKILEPILTPVRRLLTQPISELNRWQKAVRYTVAVCRYGAGELEENRASQMAAALTYRTIFSLVPLFVLSLLVFNAFGGFSSVGGNLRETIYDYLGLTAITLTETLDRPDVADITDAPPAVIRTDQPPDPADPSPAGSEPDLPPDARPTGQDPADLEADQFQTVESAPAENPNTKARIDEILTDLQEQVSNISFTGISLVTLPVLIWAAISLVVSLEQCCNRVYRAPEGRPWHLRIMIYWGVITLGPVLVALSIWLTTQVIDYANSIQGVSWVVSLLLPLASTATTWLLLLLIYTLLPNARVSVRSALIGAGIAAVMWEASKWGFGFYIRRAVTYSAFYGSLGVVPLFLLWMYLTWLIILFGLEISYVAQTLPESRVLRPRPPTDGSDRVAAPTAVLPLAALLAKAFDRGEAVPTSSLCSDTGLAEPVVQHFTTALAKAGLIHRLECDDDGPGDYTLARPAEQVPLAELLAIGRSAAAGAEASRSPHTTAMVNRLHAAEDAAAEGRTLRDLIADVATPEDSD